MRILCISEDQQLLEMVHSELKSNENEIFDHESKADPLEVMSHVCSMSPRVVIIDDDMLKPNSAKILSSIKKVNPGLKIIFFTSDSSLELGREISPLGVLYYGLKPISELEIKSLVESINKLEKVT